MGFFRKNHEDRVANRAARSVEFNQSGEALDLLKNISNAEIVKAHLPTEDFKE